MSEVNENIKTNDESNKIDVKSILKDRDLNVFRHQLRELKAYYHKIGDPREYAYERALFSLGSDDAFSKLLTGEKVYGIGPAITEKFNEFINKGIFDKLLEVRKEMGKLLSSENTNPHKHYTHRDEVALKLESLKDVIRRSLKYNCDNIEFYECGSFRRDAQYCGDGDLLIVSEDDISLEVADAIEKSGNYTFHSKGSSKLKIIEKESEFEIDVRFCKPHEKGSFILHMTGSGSFNVSMRHDAKKKGYSLSEYGLLELKNNKLHTFENEEDIFKFLGLEYIAPENRNY